MRNLQQGAIVTEVIPGVGLEVARFGEARATLRERLGEFSSFVRSPGDSPTDHFASHGLLLSFNKADRLNFIEATPASGIYFSGVLLCGRPFGEILHDLDDLKIEVDVDDAGCSLPGIGLSLYTPAPDEPDVNVEGVALSPRGNIAGVMENSPKSDTKEVASADGDGDVLF